MRKMDGEGLQKETKTEANLPQTHLFVVFDFIFCDDAVGLVGLLPGELDAALLHFLLDDLTDLGRSCLDKNMSISGGRSLSARTHAYSQPLISRATPSPTLSGPRELTNIRGDACLHLMIEISITVQTAEDSVSTAHGKLQHVDYE